ncbi:hypothetical protein [Pseudomonas sp. PSPC2-3]|uniref:hypothetical protein n=1 Tax=Pseudomonas sp. PSPC2-3 TaxID=2804561 RepID=UPI002064F01D|nr:MAG TPA: BstYI [Caudoviricetes sp.]
MFIKHITSYGNAWQTLNSDYPEIISDIEHAISTLALAITNEPNETRAKNNDPFYHSPRVALETNFSERLEERRWTALSTRDSKIANSPISLRGIGHVKSGIAVRLHRHREVFNRWLYTIAPIASKNNIITIPIAVMAATYSDASLNGGAIVALSSERITDELKALEPLSYNSPFLIIGISLKEHPITLMELDSNTYTSSKDVIINRSLEFPPEYHQAGLGILNYFGTVLRDKYPNTKARVRIEQEGLCVRLIIESENGDKEIIEKALEEYESVVRGDKTPEDFLDNKLKIIELKQELRIAEIRIDHQKDVIQFHREQVLSLTQLIGHSLSQPSAPITIDIKPAISVSSIIHNNVDIPLSEIFDNISTLSDLSAADPQMQLRLLDLEESLSLLENNKTPEETRNSSGLKKLKTFIDEASKAGTATNDFFNKIESGIELAQNIASKYNNLAAWCGAPQIPKFFLGSSN